MSQRRGLFATPLARQGATVIGALVVLASAGFPWVHQAGHSVSPFHLSPKWVITPSGSADPVKSVGILLLIAVAIIAFGLATSGRAVSIVGGAIALLLSLGFTITLARNAQEHGLFSLLGVGVYLAIVGGLITVLGGLFLGSGYRRY